MSQWKWNLKRTALLLGTGVLLAGTPTVVSAKICEETEYIAAYSNIGNGISLFDSDGNYCAGVDANIELYGLQRIPENTVLIQRRDSEWIPFSLSSLTELPSLPVGSCRVVSFQNYYAVVDTEHQSFEIMDENGTIRYHLDCEVTNFQELYVSFLKLKDGFAAAMSQGDTGMGVLFDEEGNALREIESKDVCRTIAQSWGIGDCIGNAILVTDDDRVRICDLDGRTLLQGDSCWALSGKDYTIQEYNGGRQEAPKWAVLKRDGAKYLLNEDLEETLWTSEENPTCYGDYITGIEYEQLGGRICQGFVTDGSGKNLPYALEGGTAYILTDNLLMPLLEMYLMEGEIPLQMNQDYVITKQVLGDYTARFTAYRISNWEEFYSYTGAEYEDSRLRVSDDRLYLIEELSEIENGGYAVHLYDGNGNTVFEERGTNLYVQPWKNGLWYIYRGIYKGLINGNGEWELKLTDWTE